MRPKDTKFFHARPDSLRNQETTRKLPFLQFWRKGRRPSLAVGTAAAFAILMLSTGATSASAAEVRASESATLIAALPQYTCPAGYTKLTPVAAARTTHGADVYHYAMESGPGFDSYVPPAGFKPLTATQAVLAEMNVPPRPAGGSELTSWKHDWSDYKGATQPELCESPTRLSEPAGNISGTQATHYGTDNWAGALESNGGFTAVGADWYQTTSSNGYSEVTWVGIGGFNNAKLIQDGTASPGSGYPYAWFEYLPQDQTITQGGGTFAGDSIDAQVLYTTASRGTAQFIVHDDGINELSMKESNINQDYYSGTAEFITERPAINGGLQPLGNTGDTIFNNANGINSSGSIPASSGASIVMTYDGTTQNTNNCSNTDVLQYPQDYSGSDFVSSFCRAT